MRLLSKTRGRDQWHPKVAPHYLMVVSQEAEKIMKHRAVPFAVLATFSSILLLALAPVAKPQAQGPAAEKAQKVAQILALTPQQQSQLAPILEAEAPKVKAITDDPNLSGAEKMKKLKAVHAQTDPLVKSILNPTQYKQWEQIRKDELEKMKGGG